MKNEFNNIFGQGKPNDAYAKYFLGQSYLNLLTTSDVVVANVTFEPKCRNNWHIHNSEKDYGQILFVTSGEGWYQEFGKPAQKLKAGDVVNIKTGVKHWHGATKDSWFAHLALEVPSEKGSTEWCEPVSDEEYNRLS
ncbi:MAG: cupin domain-containing protein [Clostridiaceae bacterium]|jgi:quercetin dioxygenase-like cupin family protein|nr:cupin domain-containing protein [Clostridiaceae bacterium]